MGLGLHICRLIVTQFKGEIVCKSKKDIGSEFIFLVELYNNNDDQNEDGIKRYKNPIKI